MTTKNFLSKIRGLFSASESTDVSLDCRLTVGSPSFHRRSTMLKLVSVLVLVSTLGIGNAWGGALGAGYTKITSISSLSAGDKVVLYCDDASEGVTGYSGSDATVSSTEANWIQFTVEKSSSNYFFKTGTKYIKKQTTNKFTIDGTTQSDNYCTVNSSGVLCINSRYLCKNSSYYRMYTSINSSYKPFYVYKVAASCAKKVTITKGTPETGGSFSLDKTGEQNCCDALVVTVSNIVAPSGKKFSAITQSGIASGVTINQSAKTVTYAANTTGSSTINVTYEDKGCTDHGASSITGGALSDADHGPVHAFYDYSTSQFLYTKSDLDLAAGKKGTIKSIYFEYSGAAAMAARTIKIYMANTDLSSLTTSNYVPYASFTQVYSGTFSCGSAGWYEITLDTPFDYNGAGQLAVMIDDNTNTYESSKSFKYHSATGKQIYKRQDDTDIDPASWTPASAIDYRPNTKFCIQEADMVQSTVTWVAGSNPSFGSQTDYEGTALSAPGTPSAASYCPGGKVFVGWTETPIVGEGDEPADLFTSISGKSIPVGGTTYYAVFATSGSSSKTYQFDITPSQFNTTSYDANNNQKSNTATATDASGATMTVYWTSNQIMKNSSDMQWQKNNGYIYNSTDLGTVNSVTITKSAGGYSTWYGTTEHPTSGSQGSGKGFFTVKENNTATGKSTQVRVNFTKTITTYSNYATSCCTPLGSINGSVNLTTDGCGAGELKATWKMLATTGIASQTLRVYDENLEEVTAKRITGITASTSNQTKTISGLNPCKEYYVTVENVSSGGEYCAPGAPWESDVVTTLGYTLSVTKSNCSITSGSEPARICSNVSVTYAASTGYALPTLITVTNAGAQNTGWTWNSGTGVLTINKANVTGNVSITITPTCVSPVVTADPANANYYVGDAPTPLSVTATLASGTRTYLWKVSTNGGSTWSDAEGTNNTASYSGASLSASSAGTTKFKCIVGNSQGGCTVESGVATITVNAASSWKLKGSWDSWEEHTMIEDAGVASYSISLDADSRFEFGFDGGSFYKNNGTIITTTSGWVFNTTDNNCHIHTGPAGTYTFAINTSTKAVTVTYPTVSHPNEHYVYFKNTNVWGTVYGYLANSGNDNKAAAWPGSVMQPTTTICGETYHYAALNAMSGTYNTIIFNNGNTGYGNQTSDLSTTGSLGKYNANQDANWHQFKYTISFDGNGNTDGSMSSITELCPGSNQALTSNAFTKDHYTFAGWHADVAVKVGESTIPVGSTISDGVTIKDIQSDIALTAQWTPDTYTITKTFSNVANAGLPASFTYTGSTTTALNSTFTVDATNFFLPSSIAVTMGGTPLTAGTDYTYNNSTGAFTFGKIINGNIVITATATAKLKSIAITTQPTTRKYFAGESFSSTGAVVTATMGAGTKTVSATWTPSGALSAGTSQTVTASYTENGITKTATTTIDVYSVTVNKVNEDGDEIDAAGVTATWTVGTKALAAGVGSTKYVFKQWEVTGASIGSTTSTSTTLSSPTANVVVNAVFYKPRVIKWSVGGDDSYDEGSPTLTVAYNGTISAVPDAPDDDALSCANKFMGWSTKDAGTTPKTTSYYDDLFTNASGYTTNITAATTTFYAVFAEVDEGNWTLDYSAETALSSSTDWGSYGTAYDYTASDGGTWTVKAYKNAGMQINTTKDASIKIPDCSGNITSIVITCSAAKAVGLSASDYTGSGDITYIAYGTDATSQTIDCSSKTATGGYIVPKGGSTSITKIVVNYGSASNYVTQCDANIVKVTYDANGGSTSCTNTTTDKTEDFTVCSSAPTRDYYTFAGWLCSADSKTYAASATIDDAVIDADFTLTAQWTPVTYNITYELDGGTNSGSNPATYNVTTATITLQDPSKGHDRFDGWYDNGSFTGDAITSIPLGSHGNITLYAKWTERFEIIFDADGTKTTIYRADDENMEDAVAGQGSVPSDPDAPSACDSKVFVGWSESEIDGETDTEPGDLMKPAAGTVDEDKHYYAVWADESSESGTVYVINDDFNVTGTSEVTSRSGWTSLSTIYGGSGSIRFSSGKNAGTMKLVKTGKGFGTTVTSATITFKIKKYGSDGSGVLKVSSNFSDATTTFSKDGGETTSTSGVQYSTTDGSNWTTCTCTVGSIHSGTDIILDGQTNSRVYVKDFVMSYTGTVYTYTAYSTSCCATKIVLSDPSITDASTSGSTITFDKSSPVYTCGGTKTVTATLTLTAGYQASALSFAVNSGTVSISPAISTPVTSSQVYTLTFAEDQNATLTTTATIAAKPLNGITITPSSGEVYVGQYVDFTVSYDPADYISPGYTLNATPVYVTKESAAPANTKLRLKGGRGSGPGASITETVNETVTIKASGDNTKTASVNMTVNPLPRVHFEDLVHGKAFADVVATIVENALNPNKTTKTSVDWVTPNANTCEENHLHLVGWIREDWPALVAYLNGTGDAPTTTAIVGAGNDGAGHAYYIAAGASINVHTFDGVTFYAVWAEIK